MNAAHYLFLGILLNYFHSTFASQAMTISPTGAWEHLAQNLREAQSLLADDQPPPGFFAPPPWPQAAGAQAMASQAPAGPPVATEKVDFDLTSFQQSLPLDTGIRLESDDGVWFSSKAKSKDDKNYDTNSLLSIPLKIYDKITGSGFGSGWDGGNVNQNQIRSLFILSFLFSCFTTSLTSLASEKLLQVIPTRLKQQHSFEAPDRSQLFCPPSSW